MESHVLARRGKRHVSSYFKTECIHHRGQEQLESFLDYVLSHENDIDDFETIDWCRWLIAGGLTFEEFSNTVRRYDNALMCGLVWTANFVAYRCRTCGISPCMSLCADCFQTGDHTGHDFNMFRSQAGGACDCGDPSVMKPDGFCMRHARKQGEEMRVHVPPDLLSLAEAIMPRLIVRLVQHLRKQCKPDMLGTYLLPSKEAEMYLSFLSSLTDLGGAMRQVITNALVNRQIYRNLTNVTGKESDEKTLAATQGQYLATVDALACPAVDSDMQDLPGLKSALSHESLLEELVFWTVKFELPQKIVTWLLGMLPEEIYKEAFVKAFVKHYSRISVALENSVDRKAICNKVVHISVQLFSSEKYALQMTNEYSLLYIMILCLENMMKNLCTFMQDTGNNCHLVVDCSKSSIREHCFWPIISDFVNILSHFSIAEKFLKDEKLMKMWFSILSMFQGMNVNTRELIEHVQYEPDTYYASFSAELEVCSSPMWSVLVQCKTLETSPLCKQVLQVIQGELADWFNAIGIIHNLKLNPLQVSFHIPLHRYWSTFISNAILRQNADLDLLLPDDGNRLLRLMMIHPLQIQVVFYEIFNTNMWVRNGLQIRGQAMTYIQTHFFYSLVGADLHLLQICAAKLDPDYFIRIVLERFHVLDWLTHRNNSSLEAEYEMPLLEGMLTFLTTLLSERTYTGLSEKDATRKDVVSLLCVANRSYSQIIDRIPERCSYTVGKSKDLEPLLKEIADYKSPDLEKAGPLQQGVYVPKDEIWKNEFDPLHVLLRAVQRKDFQSAMDRFSSHIRKTGEYSEAYSPWPPLRSLSDIHPAYSGLVNIMHCKTTHGFLYTILYKAVHEATVPESLMCFCIYLLDTALSTECSTTHKGKDFATDNDFSTWFNSNGIHDNVSHVIGEIAIPCDHSSSQRSRSLKAVPGLNDLMDVAQLPLESRSSSTMAENLVPSMVEEYTEDMNTSESIADSSHGPSTSIVGDTVMNLQESMISLLIKLHSKLSGKEGSYRPRKATSSKIGDGPHFIGQLLDKIGRLSDKNGVKIQEIVQSQISEVDGATSPHSRDNKRKRAKARQAKLMADFASKQKAFMEMTSHFSEIEEDSGDTSMSYEDSTQGSNEKVYDCVICGQGSPATDDKPIGLVVHLQSTSVLAHRRLNADAISIKTSDDNSTVAPPINCGMAMADRLLQLKENFDQDSCMMSVNIGWKGGVYAQTCGHYLHLSCHASYIQSIKREVQHVIGNLLDVQRGEYWCPLCRQLSSAVFPIIPQRDPGAHSTVGTQVKLSDLVHQVLNIMLMRSVTSGFSSVLTRAIGLAMDSFTFATYSQYKEHADTEISVLLFVCSILRTNLEMELFYRCSGLWSATSSKKNCILPLLHVLGMHSKILSTATLYTSLWKQVSGILSDSITGEKEVPLLLKDVTSLLIQLVLTMPPNTRKDHYQCIVKVLFNLQYIQALSVMSCQFSQEEKEAWKTKSKEIGTLEGILGTVILYLHHGDSNESSDTCHMWTPQSVEYRIIGHCLPFLRIATLLQCHLYGIEYPQSHLEEFQSLCQSLDLLHDPSVEHSTNQPFSSVQALNWACGSPMGLVRLWCDQYNRTKPQAKNLLLLNDMYYPSRLLQLPQEYDKLFQYYLKKMCSNCNRQPPNPAVCLICGEFLCARSACCQQEGCFEVVRHSIKCGAGTGIVLLVNSSIISIIRGRRIAPWGSLYLDSHGEEDRELKRGKPLYLCETRYKLLEKQWHLHSFDYTCKFWQLHHSRM